MNAVGIDVSKPSSLKAAAYICYKSERQIPIGVNTIIVHENM